MMRFEPRNSLATEASQPGTSRFGVSDAQSGHDGHRITTAEHAIALAVRCRPLRSALRIPRRRLGSGRRIGYVIAFEALPPA
jgi:hypothetical protein